MKQYTLKELREKKGWSLAETGRRMGGVSRQAIAQWENGVRTPSLHIVLKLLNIYKVKFEQVKWASEETEND